MKKFIYLLIVGCFFMLTPEKSIAQPQPFAGGEIVINHNPIGTEDCGDLHRYEVILKFYRDCGGVASMFPVDPIVYFYNPAIVKLNENDPFGPGFFEVPFTEIDNRGEIDNLCVNGDPICTEGKWYSAQVLLEESDTRWQVRHGFMRELPLPRRPIVGIGDQVHSPENLNIEQGQRYMLRSEILVQCTEPSTDATGIPPNVNSVINRTYSNTTANLITEDFVETFCHGQDYEFQIPLAENDHIPLDINLDGQEWIDVNEDGIRTVGVDLDETLEADSIFVEVTSTLAGNNSSVFYVPPYSSTRPIPLEAGTKMDVSPTGFVKFSPRLLPAETSFFGVMTFRVSEFRRKYVIEQRGLPDGTTIDSLVLAYDPDPIAVTYRQFRYIIDKSCNKQLPVFGANDGDSVKWFNFAEDAWEFDCATKDFRFTMSKPMYEHSLDRLDFRIFRGLPDGTDDDSPYAIEKVVAVDQTPREKALGEFTQFIITTDRTLGPGKYSIFTKLGNDGNTLINRCGFQVPEKTIIPIYINTDFDYDYFDRETFVDICYPQTDIELFPLVGQPNVGPGEEFRFTFTYIENRVPPPNPDTSFDAFYSGRRHPNNSYTEEVLIDSLTGDPIFKEGSWLVGLGRIYRHYFNGTTFKEVCYAEDEIRLRIFENADVKIRDWDLCPEEAWPKINLDTMVTLHNAEDFQWAYQETDPKTGEQYWQSTGPSASNALEKSVLQVNAFASGLGRKFLLRSIVRLQSGECFDTTFAEIQKNRVEVNIGNDTLFCREEKFALVNTTSFVYPDSIVYKWFVNGDEVPDSDTNALMIDEEGTYRLEITKRSEIDEFGNQTECIGEQEIEITFADSLYAPDPQCSKVTFEDGVVNQLFFWPEVKGADGYQVKTVDAQGNISEVWDDANENAVNDVFSNSPSYNQLHSTIGQEVKLIVRAYNTEVDDDAICKYGPESVITQACEVIIKPVNIFTPNGDGINDFLRFDLLELYNGNKLQIYNRWGRLIFEDTNYQNDWDGEDYKDGTYFYVLEIGDGDVKGTKNTILKGNVTIVR